MSTDTDKTGVSADEQKEEHEGKLYGKKDNILLANKFFLETRTLDAYWRHNKSYDAYRRDKRNY